MRIQLTTVSCLSLKWFSISSCIVQSYKKALVFATNSTFDVNNIHRTRITFNRKANEIRSSSPLTIEVDLIELILKRKCNQSLLKSSPKACNLIRLVWLRVDMKVDLLKWKKLFIFHEEWINKLYYSIMFQLIGHVAGSNTAFYFTISKIMPNFTLLWKLQQHCISNKLICFSNSLAIFNLSNKSLMLRRWSRNNWDKVVMKVDKIGFFVKDKRVVLPLQPHCKIKGQQTMYTQQNMTVWTTFQCKPSWQMKGVS